MSGGQPQQGMPLHLICGLLGVLLGCLTADMNAQATSLAMADIQGALGIGTRLGSWMTTLFDVGEAMGMLIAPWLAIAFSMRRFATFATLLLGVVGVGCALVHTPGVFLMLRFGQGLSTGFLIPLLMTTALRFLTPSIKLMGFAVYALTATFAPNLGAPIVAWAHQSVGYDALYLSVVPLVAIAIVLIWYGVPQDPLHLDRFKKLDWRGLLLGWTLTTCIVIVATQGERLDWMASPFLVCLTLVAVVVLPLFIYNEWYHPVPFIWPQIMLRPNFAFGTVMLFGFIILNFSVSLLPSGFLSSLHGYRPLQSMPLTLIIGLPSLVLLPLVAWVLNFKRVDARWFVVAGLAMMMLTCWLHAQVAPDWMRQNFYLGQAIATVGEAMVVVSLLKIATGVVDPTEGPYASATINTTRALAAPVGTGLIDWFLRHRTDVHSTMLLDRVGTHRAELSQSAPLTGHDAAALAPHADPSVLAAFAQQMNRQVETLAYADGWRLMLVLAGVLMLTCIVTQRVYPPRLKIPPGT
ncbi:MFS transporter [Salinisphaera sp. Q1T1-3]|uniref:MFS transporter n=1 Tax=Salinisphaera sp. Q1T1-3 TaxID=2321229 RepID=UPI000E76FCDE|nr:MFS transporter [Salinisphaera sp. Q1T1-3]RJS91156.1 MFS transporter [Salinisphaera sp. Q1T1-3]